MRTFSIAQSIVRQGWFAALVGLSLLCWIGAVAQAADAKFRPELTEQQIQRLLFTHTYGLYHNGSRIGTTWRVAAHTSDQLGGPPGTYLYRHVIEETGKNTSYYSSYFAKQPPYRLVSRKIEQFVPGGKVREVLMVPEGSRWKITTRTREGTDTKFRDDVNLTLSDALAWHAWGRAKPAKGASLAKQGFTDNETFPGAFPSEIAKVSNQTILGEPVRVVTISKLPDWVNLIYTWTLDVDEKGRITRMAWPQGVEERLEQ